VRHGLVALGARTTGDANLARGHHQERTALKRVSMFLEGRIGGRKRLAAIRCHRRDRNFRFWFSSWQFPVTIGFPTASMRGISA
jgi:hypothetical protein